MPWRWLTAAPRSTKQDRRQRQRIAQYFQCTWQSAWGVERSLVSSLSPNGCYIEDRFSVPAAGEVIQDLIVTLPTGSLSLRGTVIDPTPGIGFAVRFTELDTDTRDRLSALVQAAQL
jgi:PilZ domain-containing protein